MHETVFLNRISKAVIFVNLTLQFTFKFLHNNYVKFHD